MAANEVSADGISRSLTAYFKDSRPNYMGQIFRFQTELEQALVRSCKLVDVAAAEEEHALKLKSGSFQHSCERSCANCGKPGKFPACQKPFAAISNIFKKSKEKEVNLRVCRVCKLTYCFTDASDTCGKESVHVMVSSPSSILWSLDNLACYSYSSDQERLVLPICQACFTNLQRAERREKSAWSVQFLLTELKALDIMEQAKEQQIRIEKEIDILFNEPIKKIKTYKRRILPADVVRAEKQLDEQLSKLSTMLAKIRSLNGRIRPLATAKGIPQTSAAAAFRLCSNMLTARSEAYFELRLHFHNQFRTLFKLVLSEECSDAAAVDRALARLEFDALSCAFVRIKQLCFEILSVDLAKQVPPGPASTSGDDGDGDGQDQDQDKTTPGSAQQIQQLSQFLVECTCIIEEQIKVSGRTINEDLHGHSEICDLLVKQQFEEKPLLTDIHALYEAGKLPAQVLEIVRTIWYELERRVLSEWKLTKIRATLTRGHTSTT